MSLVLSPQQAAILKWTAYGKGSATVIAVAGAGKTTTLVELLSCTSGTVAFMAYNKAIAGEIDAKVRPLGCGNRVRCGTVHSFGFSAVRRAFPGVKVDAKRRADDVTVRLMEDFPLSWPNGEPNRALIGVILKTMSLAKQRGFGALIHYSDHKAWLDLVDHFGIEEDLPEDGNGDLEMILQAATKGLKWSAENSDVIDFDDMVWLPLVRKLRPWQNDWVLVDEAQDTNPARRALARLLLKPSGRAVFVGDPCQAIYGFTGADGDALDLIRDEFNACELPLTVSWRCPRAIVAHAQQWVSHIEAAPKAPEGSVAQLPYLQGEEGAEKIWWQSEREAERLLATDAVLCRNTKPLVELAYTLIRHGIACHVEGREIGTGLIKLCDKWKIRSCDKLHDKLEGWLERQVSQMTARGHESAAGNLVDRVETLYVLMEGCETVAELRAKIERLFSDTADGRQAANLTLSTIHKAKGREWDRVYWLGRAQLQPSAWARKEWELKQEDNLMYVAATRAKRELIEVDLPPRGPAT